MELIVERNKKILIQISLHINIFFCNFTTANILFFVAFSPHLEEHYATVGATTTTTFFFCIDDDDDGEVYNMRSCNLGRVVALASMKRQICALANHLL